MASQPPASPALTVLFDGACPLCRREISIYQGLTPNQPVHWLDVSDGSCPLPSGPGRPVLLARFHVQLPDGQLLSGAAAFVALWERLPGWRWLAALARIPGVLSVMELSYRGFLRLRPRLQALARRLER